MLISGRLIPPRMQGIPPPSKSVPIPQTSLPVWEGRWGVPRAALGAGVGGRMLRAGGNILPLVVKADARGRDAERKREKGFTSLFLRRKGGWVF